MSIRSLAIIATGEADDETAIAIGADLAKRHQAAAIVVDAFVELPPVAVSSFEAGGLADPIVLAALERRAKNVTQQIARLVAQASAVILGPQADATGALSIAEPGETIWETLCRELPLADLVVVAQSTAASEHHWGGPLSDALMEARTPVLVARSAIPFADRPAAVAWDGSFEAARAVRAALPLLASASEVMILQDPANLQAGRRAQADPERLKRYLQRRGPCVSQIVEVSGRPVSQALLEAAQSAGAALLVAGAYSHSRLKETLFGGVTRDLLHAASGPHLLLAH